MLTDLDMLNITDSIKSNNIERWHNVIRQISKLIPLDSRLRKKNYVLILSSILIVKRNTK